MPEPEQWELLERVVTTEGIAHTIFRTLFSNHRYKLPHINTFDDVVNLIQTCNNIVILTGAGVSVSCGIPDFRSPGGTYLFINLFYPFLLLTKFFFFSSSPIFTAYNIFLFTIFSMSG